MLVSDKGSVRESVRASTANYLIRVSSLSKSFGGIAALSGVSFSVMEGEIFGIIGPNGAGKTTLFNAMTGLYTPDSGEIFLGSKSLFGCKSHEVLKTGLARTFQNIRLFGNMTAMENVMVGRHSRTKCGVFSSLLRTRSFRKEEANIARFALELLDRVGLLGRANSLAKHLSYGDQRRLEIARALASEPLLLALDEPAAGMNPSEKSDLKHLLLELRSEGLSILLIEHDVRLVMDLCDRILVLDYGKPIAYGLPQEVRNDPKVVAAYLGQEDVSENASDEGAK